MDLQRIRINAIKILIHPEAKKSSVMVYQVLNYVMKEVAKFYVSKKKYERTRNLADRLINENKKLKKELSKYNSSLRILKVSVDKKLNWKNGK